MKKLALIIAMIMLLTSTVIVNAATDRKAPVPGGGKVITTSNITSSSVTLSWTAATDSVTAQSSLLYKVVRSTSNNITTVTTATANGTTVTDWSTAITTSTASGLSASTTYYFNVLVKDAAGNTAVYTSKSATTSAATTDTTAPTPGGSGVITTSGITSSSITLGWTAATDNVTAASSLQYKTVRSASNNITTATDAATNGTTVTDWTTNITTSTASGLSASTTYYFNVLVKDAAGNTAVYTSKSEITSAVSSDTTVPTVGGSGVITTGTVTSSTVPLSWTAATDNVTAQSSLQYKVVRSLSNNITTVATAEANGTTVTDWTTNITTATASGLSASTTYYFNILVKDAAGNTACYTSKSATTSAASTLTYKIVDTNQTTCYDDYYALTSFPTSSSTYYGQDAQHSGYQKSYTLSADTKTVYDNITGLTWQSSPNTTNTTPTYYDKKSYTEAQSVPATLNAMAYGGFTDWRLPTLKEMYSLILFSGIDVSGYTGTSTTGLTPFIDTNYFKFSYGDIVLDGRLLESQYYTSTTFIKNPGDRGYQKQFGVNMADGRIKGYDIVGATGDFKFFVQCVRGNTSYGINNFVDNGDYTVTDNATGLMWSKNDSASAMQWKDALAWVQTKNAANYLGHSDWRLPNAKELQSIVDYGNAPEYNSKPAINTTYFNSTSITNEEGELDYPYFWASTTHVTYYQTVSSIHAKYGTYVAFGRSLGYSSPTLIDVHGAGVQKSDPKLTSYLSTCNVATVGGVTFYYWGPQSDVVRAMNYVRLVRDAN